MIEEKIYNDKKAWTCFKGEADDEFIYVYRRCPYCGRYLKEGDLLMNLAGAIKLKNWTCKKHGEVSPYYDRLF